MRLSFLLALILFISSAHAQQIYQWTDDKGQVHFSNSPGPAHSQPSDLPELRHENIDKRIQNIKAKTPDTCIRHGGIDCSRGADSDGSVVCIDGYRDAILPFQFECMEVRLQGALSLEPSGLDANLIPHARNLVKALAGKTVKAIHLNLRNLSGVAATGMNVDILFDRRTSFHANGPERIGAYGSAEYILPLGPNTFVPTLAQIEQTEYKVSCTNCGAVMRVQSSQ